MGCIKYTIIFNFPGMKNVGGIEKYIANMSKYLIENNFRVIWFWQKDTRIAKSFRTTMLDTRIEKIIVNEKGIHWFKHSKLAFNINEEVIVLSFTPLDMGRAIFLANKFKNVKMKLFYIVPNTTGNVYYIERYFKGILYNTTYKKMKTLIKKWNDAGIIFFFSEQQIFPLENNYNIVICDKDNKVLPPLIGIPPLDIKKIRQRACRKPFTIITIGRFDFPHKGYILGLIKSYGRLKSRYNNIKLQIIGFGPDEDQVQNEIGKLDKNAQKDIELIGEVAPENLHNYLQNASLNISVAGAVRDGAELGVLSIPARNYCEGECEVYGFFPGANGKNLSREPGTLVDSYIEHVINMSDDEYIHKSIDTYKAFIPQKKPDPLYLVNQESKIENLLSLSDIKFLKKMHYITKISYVFKKKMSKNK